jgi:hypothetical protein
VETSTSIIFRGELRDGDASSSRRDLLRYDQAVLRQQKIVVPILVGWLVLAGLFVVKFGGGGEDDMFISFRYARSVAHGEGLVFNSGERHFGATEPGMALLLGGVHRLTAIPIPWIGTLATAFGLLVIAWVMVADGLLHQRLTASLVAGTLLVGSVSIWICRGAAAPMALACLLAGALVVPKRPAVAGFLAAAAVWLRPDTVLGVIALGLLLWWQKRRFPVRFGAAAAFGVFVGMALAWSYFGHPLPSTLAAKQVMAQWQPRTWPSGVDFWKAFLPSWRSHLGVFAPLFLIGGVVGWIPLWKRGGLPARILILNGAALAFAYPVLRVPFYLWYVIPVIAACFYGVSYMLSEACHWFARSSKAELSRGLMANRIEASIAVLLIVAVAMHIVPTVSGYRTPSHLDAYRDAALWIRENTLPEETVAYYEVGVVGWFSERPIQDLLGLVTPAMTENPAQGRRFGRVLREQPTEIVLDHTARRVGNLPSREWFQRTYEPVAEFPDAGGGEVVVFRKR